MKCMTFFSQKNQTNFIRIKKKSSQLQFTIYGKGTEPRKNPSTNYARLRAIVCIWIFMRGLPLIATEESLQSKRSVA